MQRSSTIKIVDWLKEYIEILEGKKKGNISSQNMLQNVSKINSFIDQTSLRNKCLNVIL